MFVKQLTVFIENRAGRLEDVAKALRDNGINIASVSLADTSDYGLLRFIVSDYEKAVKVLKESGFSAKVSDVVAVKLTQEVGQLNELLNILSGINVNIEYMYGLTSDDQSAFIVLKTSDQDATLAAVKDAGYELYTA